MKQKLMAVAVAGAFAAPAVAFAQASTVNIYGYVNAEYGFNQNATKQGGDKYPSWDGLVSPASFIGFKGEEKLSGANSAWFQCETDLGFLKGDSTVVYNTVTTAGTAEIKTAGHVSTQGGWCSRNSALGLKGGFGNFYVGHWDSPVKRAVGAHRVVGETGWQGVQGMLISNGGAFTGTFSARNSNSINYESPNFAGFSVLAQITSTAEQRNTIGSPNVSGRSNSYGLNYGAGPLAASVAYTAVEHNRSALGATGNKDKVLVVGGSYTFGAARIGLLYIDAEANTSGVNAAAANKAVSRKSYNIAGTYNLGGPHSLKAGYTVAGDTKTADGLRASGSVATNTTGVGANSGAKQYQIGYFNALSKRTNAGVIYMRNKNDSNSTGYSVGNNATTGLKLGESTSALVLTVNHTF